MDGKYMSLLTLLLTAIEGQNLFKNADFEAPFGSDNWYANGATIAQDTDAYEGTYCGKITNRRGTWAGVSQLVPAERGKAYHFTLIFKILNQWEDKLYHQVTLTLAADYEGGRREFHYLGRSPYQTVEKGWVRIGGDLRMDDEVVNSARFYLQITEADVEYMVDSAIMVEIPEVPSNWVEQANERIDTYRKNNVELRIQVSEAYDPSQIQVEVNLMRHDFPFGTAVRAVRFNADSEAERQYRDFFFDTFDWAVVENAIKWTQMEKRQGEIDFEAADRTLELLRERNIPVRGHHIICGADVSVPGWVKQLTPGELERAIAARVQYVVDHYKGKVVHWDVQNEQIHFDWFERTLGRTDLLAETFHKTRAIDQHAKLFLNDFQVVNQAWLTHAYMNSARELLSEGVPLYGLGMQSHIIGIPDLARIASRLDVLAEVGLPLWATELDISISNVTERAQAYDDVMRLYFSHPDVEGVLLWGYWEGAHSKPDAVLADGQDEFTVNEAGRRVRKLLKEEWWTGAQFAPMSRDDVFLLRGFHGLYVVKIKADGEEIKSQQFYLYRGIDTIVNISI